MNVKSFRELVSQRLLQNVEVHSLPAFRRYVEDRILVVNNKMKQENLDLEWHGDKELQHLVYEILDSEKAMWELTLELADKCETRLEMNGVQSS